MYVHTYVYAGKYVCLRRLVSSRYAWLPADLAHCRLLSAPTMQYALHQPSAGVVTTHPHTHLSMLQAWHTAPSGFQLGAGA